MHVAEHLASTKLHFGAKVASGDVALASEFLLQTPTSELRVFARDVRFGEIVLSLSSGLYWKKGDWTWEAESRTWKCDFFTDKTFGLILW